MRTLPTFSCRVLPLCIAALAGLSACESAPADQGSTSTAPRATVTDPMPAAVAEASARRFTFDQKASKIGFVGKKVTGSHAGGFQTFSGVVEVGPGGVDKGTVSLSIDMASVFSDSERLTGHLKSPDFFDVDKNPTTTFTSSSIAAGEGGAKLVSGTLDLHGVKKGVTFPATITATDSAVTVKATFLLNRKDFAINYPGKANDLISDDVELTFDISASPAAAAPADGAAPPAEAAPAEAAPAEAAPAEAAAPAGGAAPATP